MNNNQTVIESSDNKNDNDIAWEAGAQMIMDNIKPSFKNLKDEVLNNEFAKISKRCWNDTLRKCQAIYKGNIASTEKKEWCQNLKKNDISLKHLVALKIYCDFDDLQREFRKCFRAPYNLDTNRLSSFYWWNKILSKTFRTFNEIEGENKKYDLLFHGISSVMCIDKFKGKYFGPLSTTTDINVARSFAGKSGMILVIAPIYNEENKPFDISYLSEFSDEHEVLCFDQKYVIKNIILSHEFDENILIYDSMYTSNTTYTNNCTNVNTLVNTAIIGEPDHEIESSDDESEYNYEQDIEIISHQNETIKCLYKLSELIINNNGYIEIECVLKFLFHFIFEHINNKLPTNFDVFIDLNLKYMINKCNQCKISINILKQIADTESCNVCVDQIKDIFSQYFNSNNVQFV